ncbi:unnamed protein product [Prorocentrum cordatum]|uniref:Polynucleotide adenylyltransferase n=1 Tax=Prorocentrum cordatum TaxID=2364126 RepID=A0ABN9T1H4_9DINO|nr:unnamed protein product [Polarella glacialis]
MSSIFTTRMATMDTRSVIILAIAVCCAVLPLEITHLLSACVGAGLYLLVQALQGASVPPNRAGPREAQGGKAAKAWRPGTSREWAPRSAERPARCRDGPGCGRPAPEVAGRGAPRLEVRKPSAVPVLAPTFQSSGWEAEVAELLDQLAPTKEGEEVVRQISATVRAAVARVIPEAEVSGFACGSLVSGKAFGVAVPEVDIVVNANPQALLGRLQGRWSAGPRSARLDARKLQKSAIRACTDQLVSTGTFKFRRSAFRGDEPKVTMIAPSSMDGCEQGIPINLSVNTVTPVYNAVLLAECGHMEPRAKELALLVKRWAKDRGLCHTAKGHLPPYAWTLLTIYYLQVAAFEDETPLLPALEGTRALSAQAVKDAWKQSREPPAPSGGRSPQLSIGELSRVSSSSTPRSTTGATRLYPCVAENVTPPTSRCPSTSSSTTTARPRRSVRASRTRSRPPATWATAPVRRACTTSSRRAQARGGPLRGGCVPDGAADAVGARRGGGARGRRGDVRRRPPPPEAVPAPFPRSAGRLWAPAEARSRRRRR